MTPRTNLRGGLLALGLLALGLLGCDPVPDDDASPSALPDDANLAAVQAWLVAGHYLEWERHDPIPAPGMTGGARVYLSPELAASLRAGASIHPPGAAAVRELVDAADPTQTVGLALSHKLEAREADSPEADAWFFYEVYSFELDGEALVAERGAPGCVGCHQDGVDFVRSQLD